MKILSVSDNIRRINATIEISRITLNNMHQLSMIKSQTNIPSQFLYNWRSRGLLNDPLKNYGNAILLGGKHYILVSRKCISRDVYQGLETVRFVH